MKDILISKTYTINKHQLIFKNEQLTLENSNLKNQLETKMIKLKAKEAII